MALAWSSASRSPMMVQGVDPGRRQDPGLPHPAAEHLPEAMDPVDKRAGPRHQGADGRPQPFGQTDRNRVRPLGVFPGFDSRGDRGVPKPGPIEMDHQALRPGQVGNSGDLLQRIDAREHLSAGEDRRSSHLGPGEGLVVHLDGARLWNASIATEIEPRNRPKGRLGFRCACPKGWGRPWVPGGGPARLSTGSIASGRCSAAGCGRPGSWRRPGSTPWTIIGNGWRKTTPTPSGWPWASRNSPGASVDPDHRHRHLRRHHRDSTPQE